MEWISGKMDKNEEASCGNTMVVKINYDWIYEQIIERCPSLDALLLKKALSDMDEQNLKKL
jgi:hypothetical protein